MITTITVYDKNECDYELDVQVDYSVFWGEVSIDYIRHIDGKYPDCVDIDNLCDYVHKEDLKYPDCVDIDNLCDYVHKEDLVEQIKAYTEEVNCDYGI